MTALAVMRPASSFQLDWTARFTTAAALALLFLAVQLNWFGMLPGAAVDIRVQAPLLALIGWYAIRVGAVSMSVGLGLALIAVQLNQLTLALGVAPLMTSLPDDYWLTTITRVAAVWAAYPLFAAALARPLPMRLAPLAAGLALLPLPFLREDDPARVLASLVGSADGTFLVLPVAWIPLAAAASALAVVLDVAARQPRLVLVVPVLFTLCTIGIPTTARVSEQLALVDGIEVSPARGGPVEPVRVTARFEDEAAIRASWDGQLVRGASMSNTRGRDVSLVLAPVQQSAHDPGVHEIRLSSTTTSRGATYEVVAPGGIDIHMRAERVEVIGRPHVDVRVVILGPVGTESLSVRLDAEGRWSAGRALPPGEYLIYAQQASSWNRVRLTIAR